MNERTIELLKSLNQLKEGKILTEEEFEIEKKKILEGNVDVDINEYQINHENAENENEINENQNFDTFLENSINKRVNTDEIFHYEGYLLDSDQQFNFTYKKILNQFENINQDKGEYFDGESIMKNEISILDPGTRMGRLEYAYYNLFYFILYLLTIRFFYSEWKLVELNMLISLFYFLIFAPILFLFTNHKRILDINSNYKGFMMLIMFILGPIGFLYLCFAEGTIGANKYGYREKSNQILWRSNKKFKKEES